MPVLQYNSQNVPHIVKNEAICILLNGIIPSPTSLITDVFKSLDRSIRSLNNRITTEALSNAHGDWYEWLLAISAWNYCAVNPNANLALLTPNIRQFDIASLYKSNLYGLIQDLRQKVQDSSSVQLITSNPDFVIIDRSCIDRVGINIQNIPSLTVANISMIETAYTSLVNECGFNDIHGYISVKTSLRPDRRLQISHEGSLMKALYTHLQTREWIINPQGLKYYAFATAIGRADRQGLKTVATHSITTVHSIPQAAVDEVYVVNSMEKATETFSTILSP